MKGYRVGMFLSAMALGAILAIAFVSTCFEWGPPESHATLFDPKIEAIMEEYPDATEIVFAIDPDVPNEIRLIHVLYQYEVGTSEAH